MEAKIGLGRKMGRHPVKGKFVVLSTSFIESKLELALLYNFLPV